jgi:hypothetical protein
MMYLDKLIDISSKADSIDTSESYCENCYIFDDSLLIPFIKLEILDSKVIGNNQGRLNLEFSYLIIEGFNELNWIGMNPKGDKIVGGLKVDHNESFRLKDWFGVFGRNAGFEIKAMYNKLLLFVPSGSRIGLDCWTPWKTPNFPQNIKTEIVKDFFELKNLPSQLQKVLDLKMHSKLRFEKGNEIESKMIEDNWIK